MRKAYLIYIIFIVFFSCRHEPDDEVTPVYKATPYTINIPKGFPTNLNIPADNPMTVEGIELGRLLFYDGRLSGRTDTLMSCASCHNQKYAFEVGNKNSKYSYQGRTFGVSGIKTPHFMLPIINLVWNSYGYLWNGAIYKENPDISRRNLEDLVWMGVVAPHEMKGDTNRTVALIKSIDIYPPLFKKAFGSDKITMKNIGKAIAQFIRTLISSNSKFDKYLRGEITLSDDERVGFSLFVTETGADCFHCHGTEGNPLFTTNLFYNNGKDTCFTGICQDTRDRYAITKNEKDRGAYKATTLRNIELTGPYMHDGRFNTLDEVIDFYSSGLHWSPYADRLMHHIQNNGNQLSPKQKAQLKAFLLTLTDNDFITNPAFANPRPEDPFFISNE
ncbi:MAG: hypothetical protein KA792_00780 [Bacteroidales bacterium]|nr:hypothetical protein [Bacteroidales bacterium]